MKRLLTILKQQLRLMAAVQVMAATEGGEEAPLVGGQALLEGVMMRSPHAWGVAVRKENGEIVTHNEPLDKPSDRKKWLGWPFVRGLVTLGQAMKLGYRALQYSVNVALEDAQKEVAPEKRIEFKGPLMYANLFFSFAFMIVMYKFIPYFLATKFGHTYSNFNGRVGFAVVEGLVRISILLGFMYVLSRMDDIHRMFQYHGGEHKTVFSVESGEELTVANAQKWTTYHPRCGTSFLMTLMLLMIPLYIAIPRINFAVDMTVRVLMLVVMSSVSYEVIRFAAKSKSGIFTVLTMPGLWLQRITTQPPDDKMVECAITALNEAFVLERERGGQLTLA